MKWNLYKSRMKLIWNRESKSNENDIKPESNLVWLN